jgi:hypothetical protein
VQNETIFNPLACHRIIEVIEDEKELAEEGVESCKKINE